MRSLILATLMLTPLFAQAQTPGLFACKVSTSHASMKLKPLSAAETYMQSAQFEDLTVSTYQNEDGVSYTVGVKRGKTLLAQADIVMYQDTSLRLNTGNEMITVQCLTTSQQ